MECKLGWKVTWGLKVQVSLLVKCPCNKKVNTAIKKEKRK